MQVECLIYGLNPYQRSKLHFLSEVEVGGIPSVAVKCVDIRRNTSGEGGFLDWKLTLRHESVGSEQD